MGRLKAEVNQQVALHPISVPEREGGTIQVQLVIIHDGTLQASLG